MLHILLKLAFRKIQQWNRGVMKKKILIFSDLLCTHWYLLPMQPLSKCTNQQCLIFSNFSSHQDFIVVPYRKHALENGKTWKQFCPPIKLPWPRNIFFHFSWQRANIFLLSVREAVGSNIFLQFLTLKLVLSRVAWDLAWKLALFRFFCKFRAFVFCFLARWDTLKQQFKENQGKDGKKLS